ncbi:hypothetical protein DIPPA_14151 [Diplonema papillatum]|nr:hypothetical protein DIPPA_14151 [Diplonema papillatum]
MVHTTGRREHLEEDKFIRELEKMYNEGRREGNGSVAISFSKMPDKWWQKEVDRKNKKNKKKGAPIADSGTGKARAIVRGKRKGKTISCIIGEDAVLKFQLQLSNLVRSSVDTLKRAEKSLKAKQEKREKQKAKREAQAKAKSEAKQEQKPAE